MTDDHVSLRSVGVQSNNKNIVRGPLVSARGRNGFFKCRFVAVSGDSDDSKVKQVAPSAAGDVAGVSQMML